MALIVQPWLVLPPTRVSYCLLQERMTVWRQTHSLTLAENEGFLQTGGTVLSLACKMRPQRLKGLGQTHTLLILGCANVTHRDADRKTSKSIYLTAMISGLD